MTTSTTTRREDILRVATSLFRIRGYHGTRMDDIADAAQLNKATVYYYYRSKADILYAIYLKATGETLNLTAIDDSGSSPAEILRRHAQHQLRLVARDLDQASVYFQEAPFIAEWFSAEQIAEIRRRESRYARGVREIIDRGFGEGLFTGGDPAIVTAAYVGMTSWFYRWYDPRRTGDPERIATRFVEILLGGILAVRTRAEPA